MIENTYETTGLQELTQLHASTLMLITQFSSGHRCPKLAHMIVNQLHRLITETELEQMPAGRQTYKQLLKHWQQVTRSLLEERQTESRQVRYH